MKTLNNIVLEQRRKALDYSKNISQNHKPFTSPLEVKLKRHHMGTYCGAFFIVVSGVFFIFKIYSLATGLFIGGITTLGFNLVLLKSLNKK